MTSVYRPWGPLNWLMPKLPTYRWGLLGVLGTEDRCTVTFSEAQGFIDVARFLHIIDPYPSPAAAFEARYAEIKQRLIRAGAQEENFITAELIQDIDTMRQEAEEFIALSGDHIILDITSMPKWWFFPLIRFILQDDRVKSLVVTYASALKYGEQLSSDPAPLASLPTYNEPRTEDHYEEIIIGIGFAPLGLKDIYESDASKIRYLFPFPPGPPNFYRNWNFLRTLEAEVENRNMRSDDRWQVHMYDVPNAFDALRRFTKDASKSSALAPFGPKTISLAMCVFALAAAEAGKEPVHALYTQPRRYALDYTRGVKEINGSPDIKAYCLKLRGELIYKL